MKHLKKSPTQSHQKPLLPSLFIVIPVHNEEQNIAELVGNIKAALSSEWSSRYRLQFVDDGSTDNTWDQVGLAAKKNNWISAIRLRKKSGKTIAMSQGFGCLKHEDVVVTMDGDLQDDPLEIPKLVKKLQEGYGLVNGWKQSRKDSLIKRISSWMFNSYIRVVFKVPVHDINCGIKAIRADAVKNLEFWGDMHRFLPVLVQDLGYSITEIPVRHFARKHGRSKYGITRIFSGFTQSLLVLVMTKFKKSPLQVLGLLGFGVLLISILCLLYLFIIWLLPLGPIGTRPLFIVSLAGLAIGLQLILFGVVAELLISSKDRSETNARYIAEVIE